MTPSLWFAIGSALGGVLGWTLARWRMAPPRRAPELVVPVGATPPLPDITVGMSSMLASLATGIEGNAQLLCEAIDSGATVEPHAEQLCAVVRRLRTLSETIQLAIEPGSTQRQRLRVDDVIAAVLHELEPANHGRFQVAVDTAGCVPEVMSDARSLRQALLLLVDLVFGYEPAASKLTVRSRTVLEETGHAVVIELVAEVEEHETVRPTSRAHLTLAQHAANNLLRALGAHWTLQLTPNLEATARVTLPAADDDDAELPIDERPPVLPRHEFGGALVLVSDPAVRAMVCRELERAGRQVFSCAEGASARALWRATPDRFEVLVVETQGTRVPGDALVAEALAAQPAVRAVLLGRTDLPGLLAAVDRRHAPVVVVRQPFGLMELRDALAHVGIEPEPATP